MNTITLTVEATAENLRKLATLFEEEETAISLTEAKKAMVNTAKAMKKAVEEPKKPVAKEEPPKGVEDPTVPEMSAPKIDKTVLRNRGMELTKAGRSAEFKAVLKKYGAEKLSQINEEDYEAFYADLMEVE